ncbi:MAG: proprotein convertase P-domain-containing protein, partial [Planctomycetota bacterium]
TSDIASVIQEIVDQDGWAAGNALVIIITQAPDIASTGIREPESYDGAGGSEDRRPVLVVQYGADHGPVDEVAREAEDADVLGAAWRVVDDPLSSGGQHIGSEDGDGNDNDTAPGEEWMAVYNFDAAGGIYKVLLRGQEAGSDSFWVRIPGATAQSYEDPDQPETGWVRYNGFDAPDGVMAWDEVHSDDHDKDIVYWELPAGAHTIEIAKREDGVMFDSFIITNDLNLQQNGLPGAGASTLEIRVAAGNDNAEQFGRGDPVHFGSSDLEILVDTDFPDITQVIGLRFLDVLVSAGGLVSGAYVEFEIDEEDRAGGLPVNVVIEGELSADAAPFENVDNNITDRPTTEAKVKWSIPAGLAVSDKVRTPDISIIIREIVGQSDWAVGNALVLIIRDDPDNPSEGIRTMESSNGEAENAALLHLNTIIPLAKDPVPADGAGGVSTAAKISTFFSDDVPKKVPQAYGNSPRGVNSTLTAADSIDIKDLNVELDIDMPGNNADLNAYLTAPDGKKVKLFDDVGRAMDDFTNTILDDEASMSIKDGSEPFTGIYKPEGKLSDFDGRDTAGDWTLRIEDDWNISGAGKTATLNSWRIVVENPIVVSWTASAGAASQDVYFSDNFDDVNGVDDAGLIGNVGAGVGSAEVGALELGTTYYWRVDSMNDDGSLQSMGNVWSFTTGSGNVVVERRITDDADDCEEDLNPSKLGENDLTSSDLEMPYEDGGQGDPQIIGVRWRDIPLVADNVIVEAWVRFQVDENRDESTGPVNLVIEGDLNPDPDAFVGGGPGTFNISSRARTETQVLWSPPGWPNIGDQGPDQTTADISPIIEELLGQEEWAAGNAMALIISDDPCNPSQGLRIAEAGPGDDSALLHIIAITEAASNPGPANGAIDVDQNVILAWAPGFSGVSRDVYFGTDENPPKLERTTGTSYKPGKLTTSTTYYWRVDEYDADGNKTEGAVNSFTTVIGEATNPDPANYAAGVPLDAVLSWTPGATAVSSDVYFGKDGALEFMGNQAEASFDPSGLEMEASYSWRIDSVEEDGTTHVGDVWTFKAPREGFGTILREVWEGISGTSVSDLTSDPAYPSSPTWSEEITSYETPTDFADNFGSRVHGWLQPVTSGDYTFWIATDDNSELWLSTDEMPANAVVIARTTAWAPARAFDDPDVVPSEAIALEGGKSYYISGIYKEGGGGDNLAVAWQGPDSPERAIISGYYLTPFVNFWANTPDPADGSTLLQTFALLNWSAGVTAESHNVYVSDNMDDVVGRADAAFAGNQAAASLTVGLPGSPLPDGLGGATYYWAVDEVEADPNVVHAGPVWSFTVPPASAHNPSPADGAENVAANVTLSWESGLGAKLHSVYFGDDLDTVTNAVGAPPLPLTTYNPGPLEAGKTYYWRVDEFNPPTNVTGAVWSFTVAP